MYCVIRRLWVQAALRGEDSADTPHDGLRNRHQQVRRVGPHLTEVAFEDDLAVLQHDDSIGPRVRQHFQDSGGTGAEPRHGDVVESQWVVGARQRLRPCAPGDALRGNDLAQMLEGPLVEGWLLPVLHAHHRLAGWGEPRHQGIGHSAHPILQLPMPAREIRPHPAAPVSSVTPWATVTYQCGPPKSSVVSTLLACVRTRSDRGQLLQPRCWRTIRRLKDSGIGREFGPEGLDNYLQSQSIYASGAVIADGQLTGVCRDNTQVDHSGPQ